MRRICLLALCVFALGVAPLALSAQDGAASESGRYWFVELSNPPAADGGSTSALKAEKQAFRTAARAAGLNYKERFAFDTLWNGFSLEINPADLGKVARLPGVKAIYPVEVISLAPVGDDPGNEINLATALAMTGADIAQSVHGLTGAGIRVGVIDTGLDYNHPAFGGSGIRGNTADFPGSRVVTGFDFVGDNFNSSGATPTEQTPVPDPDPDDCNGHGTHVSGIVGANGGGVKGVAPGVTFGAYRVFGCTGTTSSDIMIAAMERALADGMHVVNMSIGSSFQWPQFPTAQAATRLVNKGVVVVCSIGNSGANGLYSSSAPGVGQKVIGVASFNNTFNNQPLFRVSPDSLAINYSPAVNGTRAVPTSGTFDLARTGTQTTTNDACNAVAPAPGSLAGKVALIRRGTCGFYEKSINAQNAGAIAVVIYNNAAGALTPNIAPPVAGDPLVQIPVVATTQVNGNLIDTRLAGGPVSITWTAEVTSTPITTGNTISSFSSYGLAPDLSLKPDIGAPGGTIRSTFPIEQGSFGLNSGTSMSSPHVAGAAALVLEAHPNTPSQAMGRVLQNNASPRLWFGNPSLGLIESVHREGAGMVNIPAAVQATTRIEPGKLALGETEGGPITRTLTLENHGSADVTYDLSHLPAVATGPNTFTPAFFNAPSIVTFSSPSVMVPAGGSASVDVTIDANPGLADRSLFGGHVVFTPQGGGQSYHVPFAGFKGDYQSIPVLVPTANNFPRMARQNPNGTFTFLPVGDGGIWTLQNAQEIPFVAAHFDHQPRRVRMEIFDAATGKAWHRALELEYFGRNSAATSFFALPWDGTTVNGKKLNTVPNGQYVIVMTVEKALGDSSNPAHVETWTSPVITLARP
jgi:minor extracellular serine protease Vpr